MTDIVQLKTEAVTIVGTQCQMEAVTIVRTQCQMTDIVQLKTISRHDSWIVGWLDHLDGHCPTQDSSRHASQNSVPSQHGTNLIHLFSLITVRRHVVSSHFSLTKCVCGGNSCDSIAPFSWQKTKTKKIFVWVIHVAVSKHTHKNKTKQNNNKILKKIPLYVVVVVVVLIVIKTTTIILIIINTSFVMKQTCWSISGSLESPTGSGTPHCKASSTHNN